MGSLRKILSPSATDGKEAVRLITAQDIFIQKRAHRLLGRERELEILENFTEAEMADGELDLAQRVLFVCSHSGAGKSSLLSRHVQNLRNVSTSSIIVLRIF